jgi:hypothetical protein
MELHAGEKRSDHTGQAYRPHGGAYFPLVGPNTANFASTKSSWPKTNYIYPPLAISRWGGIETENTRHRSVDCEDRRGDAVEAPPDCPFASIDIISFVSMMKRE